MKIHLLTAALAIVAVGGVFARNANSNKGTKLASTYYEEVSPTICNQITCDPSFLGTNCQASFTLWDGVGCTGDEAIPAPGSKRPL